MFLPPLTKVPKNNKWWYRTTCNMTKMSHADLAQVGTIASANLSDQAQLVHFLLLPSLLWQHTRSPLSSQISNQSILQATDPSNSPAILTITHNSFPAHITKSECKCSEYPHFTQYISSFQYLVTIFIQTVIAISQLCALLYQAFQQWINYKISWKTKAHDLYPSYRVSFKSPILLNEELTPHREHLRS